MATTYEYYAKYTRPDGTPAKKKVPNLDSNINSTRLSSVVSVLYFLSNNNMNCLREVVRRNLNLEANPYGN